MTPGTNHHHPNAHQTRPHSPPKKIQIWLNMFWIHPQTSWTSPLLQPPMHMHLSEKSKLRTDITQLLLDKIDEQLDKKERERLI